MRWTVTGIYISEAKPGFPIPGEAVTVEAMSMYRLVDGKIAEDWSSEVFRPAGISNDAIHRWSAKRERGGRSHDDARLDFDVTPESAS